MVEELESLLRTALGQIESALDSKHVVGDPVTVGDYTIVPLVSIGFGVGVGSGKAKAEEFVKGEGSGGASAGGGGIKPVAVVIIGPDGAKVEYFKRNAPSMLESLASTVKRAGLIENGDG